MWQQNSVNQVSVKCGIPVIEERKILWAQSIVEISSLKSYLPWAMLVLENILQILPVIYTDLHCTGDTV